jgi:hypothetical protein
MLTGAVRDEAGRNHHWSGRNHGDDHFVHELAVGEPVVPLHNASVQERNDGQPNAKHEGPSEDKKGEDGP